MCYIGIHATALKTTAMMINSERKVLNVTEGNPFHLREYPEDENYTALNGLLMNLANGASHPPISDTNCRYICISCSSVRSDWDRYHITKLLSYAGLTGIPHLITGDGSVTLAAGGLSDVGVAITVGSGSTVFGVDNKRNEWQVGGWSTLVGEDPGGYEIAHRALTAIVRAHDGRGVPCDVLKELILGRLNVRSIEELLSMLDAFRSMGYSAKIADLVPAIVKAAEEANDSVAKRILDDIANELYIAFLEVERRLKWGKNIVKVVCEGGVIENSAYLRDRLSQHFKEAHSKIRIEEAIFRPVVGATLFALMGSSTLPKNPISIKDEISKFIDNSPILMKSHYWNLLFGPGIKTL